MNTTFDSKTIVMMAENGHSVEIDGKRIQMTIVTDAETSKKQPDYSHLVGKWVKCFPPSINEHTAGKWYQVTSVDRGIHIRDNFGNDDFRWKFDTAAFDLSNPLDHNPSEVRVFDVPSEIKISYYLDSLNLHFGEHQALRYNKEKHCYAVMSSAKARDPFPCIATECKFEDLQDGDLVFVTDDKNPNFCDIERYKFVNKHKKFIWTSIGCVYIHGAQASYYFKITAKP